MIKLAVGLAVFGILAIAGMQLVPVYIHNHAVSKIAQETVSDTELSSKSKREVLGKLRTQFAQNDLGHLDPKDVMAIERDANGNLVLDVKYEERRKLMYNLEIVAGFDEQFTN